MIENNGALINKITVCIDDISLATIMNKITDFYKYWSWDDKVELENRTINIEDEIKAGLDRYINSLQSFTYTKSYSLLQNGELDLFNFVDRRMIPEFYNSIGEGFTLSKYLKVKIQTKEQGRCCIHDGISDKETKKSILYEFDIEKYREYTKQDNGLEYVLPLIKMLLFVDLRTVFNDLFIDPTLLQMLDFTKEIENKIDCSIITALNITDTLNSTDLLYEDYFYELTQIRTDSLNKLKKINHRKQKVTFRIDSFKQYGNPKSIEEQEKAILESAQDLKDKELASLKCINKAFYRDAIESGAAAKHDINTEKLYGIPAYEPYNNRDDDTDIESQLEDQLPDDELYIGQVRTHKSKMVEKTSKRHISVSFYKDDKNKNGREIKIDFLVEGKKNVEKLLCLGESEAEDEDKINRNNSVPKHSPYIIDLLLIEQQVVFDYGLYSLFQSISDVEEEFKYINKPLFSAYTNFIRKDCIDEAKTKQDNLIPKIILAILMDKGNKEFQNSILNFFEPSQQKDLSNLLDKLRKKKYNENKKESALISLYKYFEDKINAE